MTCCQLQYLELSGQKQLRSVTFFTFFVLFLLLLRLVQDAGFVTVIMEYATNSRNEALLMFGFQPVYFWNSYCVIHCITVSNAGMTVFLQPWTSSSENVLHATNTNL